MRQKRAKTYRKLLRSYVQHFNFREPFQVLLDDSFLLTLSKHKVSDPLKRITDLIQTEKDAKLMITQCAIVSLYKKEKEGQEFKDAVGLAKLAERRKCNHRDPIEVEDCIKSVVGPSNQHRYILAADSASIRHHLRNNVLGVPVIHHNDRGVMVMEPMSDLTRTRIEQLEYRKLSATKSEAELLGTGNSSSLDNIIGSSENKETDPAASTSISETQPQPQPPLPKKKKAKEPNPLSMKKSKKQKELEEKAKKEKARLKAQQKLKAKSENGSSKGKSKEDPVSSSHSANTISASDAENQKAGEKRKREDSDHSKKSSSGGNRLQDANGKGLGGKSGGNKKRRKRGKGGKGELPHPKAGTTEIQA